MSTIKKSKFNLDFVLKLAGWSVCGFITWWLSIYIFSFGLSELVSPILNYLSDLKSPVLFLHLASFFLFHLPDIALAFVFSLLLTIVIGYRHFWLIAFVLFSAHSSILALFGTITFDQRHYGEVQSWRLSWYVSEVVFVVVVLPLFVYLGSVLGRYLQQRPSNQALKRGKIPG